MDRPAPHPTDSPLQRPPTITFEPGEDPFLVLHRQWGWLKIKDDALYQLQVRQAAGQPTCWESLGVSIVFQEYESPKHQRFEITAENVHRVVTDDEPHGSEANRRVTDFLRAELQRREAQRVAIRNDTGLENTLRLQSDLIGEIDLLGASMIKMAPTTPEGIACKARWLAEASTYCFNKGGLFNKEHWPRYLQELGKAAENVAVLGQMAAGSRQRFDAARAVADTSGQV